MSNNELIIITGRTPSKKNSKVISCRGSRPLLLSSKKHKEWHEVASWELKLYYTGKRNIEKCDVVITFFLPDKRKADLTNKAESIMDLLVDNGILEDDNCYVCGDVHLKFGGVDKESPRVEIELNIK